MSEKFGNNPPTLEDHRFMASAESLAWMKELRDLFVNNEQFPEIEGVSFFGSRTTGIDKEGSDMDVVFFYDSSKRGEKMDTKRVTAKIKGYLNSEVIKQQLHQLPAVGVKGVYDLAPKATYDLVDTFDRPTPGQEKRNTGLESGVQEVFEKEWDIASRFFLGAGNELYENRRLIFDALESDMNGEKKWKEILEILSRIEREKITSKRGALSSYTNYPQTIAEARKFFKQQEITKKTISNGTNGSNNESSTGE